MMTSTFDSNCKDGVSKSNDGVCEVNNMLQVMGTADNNVSTCAVNCDNEGDYITDEKDMVLAVCANCGKEGAKNICNKCNQVKYCNAVCKKVHKKKHKKDCEENIRLAAEHAAKWHDEELFKQPPPAEDCPICFLLLPTLNTGSKYKECCGKEICSGCVYAPVYDNQGNEVDNEKCAFCRAPCPSSVEELVEREMKRAKMNDAHAIGKQGYYYAEGIRGFPQDYTKALELFHRAGELGYAKALCAIGIAYDKGEGVEVDEEMATHYYELAAMGGDMQARYNLGLEEEEAGNVERALKHHMIAIRGGYNNSLSMIKEMYTKGYVTKEDYTKALQSYQSYLSEIRSPQRDKAAATYGENCRYY